MRTLIISDIHANLTALDAVLQDAGNYDRVWCLGDVVGYGPDPNQCIERIREQPGLQCIKGNHDAAILGEIPITSFNNEARNSLEWLQSALTDDNRHWLSKLAERIEMDGITLVHGSPRNPIWEYIMDLVSAFENMTEFSTSICLVGHTHVQGVFKLENPGHDSARFITPQPGKPFSLEGKSILNPGSVGQPRDHDPKAAYCIYDDEQSQWIFHRVAYDFNQVQRRIFSNGLPKRHASRLAHGY